MFGGSEDAYVREVSFIDPIKQTATITGVNLNLSQYATCYEVIQYTPSSSDPARTTFTQTAEIQARMAVWRTVADKVEQWLVNKFEENAALGRKGFLSVLEKTHWESATSS